MATSASFDLTRRHRTAFLLVLAATVLGPAAGASALDLSLTTANDIVSEQDDLYTAELAAAFSGERWRIAFGERLFTDRERGLRFDETYLSARRTLGELRGWRADGELGVLHVGRGFAGERLQNAVHRAIGDDEVHLAYPAGARWFPTLALDLERTLVARPAATVSLVGRLTAAPGFQNGARAGLAAEVALGAGFTARAEVGAMANDVESPLLGDRIRDTGPTARLGLAYRHLVLEWAYNEYGTDTGHATIAVRTGLRGVTRGR